MTSEIAKHRWVCCFLLFSLTFLGAQIVAAQKQETYCSGHQPIGPCETRVCGKNGEWVVESVHPGVACTEAGQKGTCIAEGTAPHESAYCSAPYTICPPGLTWFFSIKTCRPCSIRITYRLPMAYSTLTN